MENQIRELKLLSIAYQSALEYDYCPEVEEVDEIKETFLFADKHSIEDIKDALNEYCGYRPDEISSKICFIIDSL